MTALSTPNRPIDDRPDGRGWRRLIASVSDATERLANVRVWLPVAVTCAAFTVVFFGSSTPFSIPTVETACGTTPPRTRRRDRRRGALLPVLLRTHGAGGLPGAPGG